MANGPVIANAKVVIIPSMEGSRTAIANAIIPAAQSAGSQGGTKLGNAMASGIKTSLSVAKVAIGNIIANIATQGINYITGTLSRAVTRLDIIENYPKIMTNIGYSTDDAQRSIDKMVESLDGLPTATDDLVRFVQRLTTATRDIEKSTAAAIGFNDMLLSSPTDVTLQKNAMEQFAQMLAVGKPDMMAWKSVINAMPAAMDQLARSLLGPTSNALELYDALGGNKHEQTVTWDQLLDKIIELDTVGGDGIRAFSEQAGVASESVGTALKNMQNRTAKALQVIMKEIGQVNISKAIDKVSYKVADIGVRIAKFISQVRSGESVFAEPLNRLAAAIKNLTGNIGGKLKSVFDGNKNAIENWVVRGINLAAKAIEWLIKLIDKLWGILGNAVGVVKKLYNSVKKPIKALFNNLKENAKKYSNLVKPSIESIKSTIEGLFNSQIESGSFTDRLMGIVDALQKVSDAIIPITADITNKVVGWASTAIQQSIPFVENFLDKSTEALGWFGDNISSVITPILSSIGKVFESTAGFASRIFDTIVGNKPEELVDESFTDGLAHGVEVFKNLIVTTIDSVGKILDVIFPRIERFVTWITGVISGVSGNAADGLVGGITSAIKWLGDNAERILGPIFDMIERIGGALFENLVHVFDSIGGALDRISQVFSNGESVEQAELANTARFEKLRQILDTVTTLIVTVITTIRKIFDAIFPRIVSFVEWLIEKLNLKGGQGSDALLNILMKFTEIIQWLGDNAERILGPIMDMFTKIGTSLFDGIISAFDALSNAMKNISDAFSGNDDPIIRWAEKIDADVRWAQRIPEERFVKQLPATRIPRVRLAEKLDGDVRYAQRITDGTPFGKFAAIIQTVTTLITSAIEAIGKVFNAVIPGITSFIEWLMSKLKSGAGQGSNFLVEVFGKLTEAMKWIGDNSERIFGALFDFLSKIGTALFDNLIVIFNTVGESLTKVFGTLSSHAPEDGLTTYENALGSMANAIAGIFNVLGSVISGLVEVFAKVFEVIMAVASAISKEVAPKFEQYFGKMGEGDFFGGIIDAVGSIKDAIIELLDKIKKDSPYIAWLAGIVADTIFPIVKLIHDILSDKVNQAIIKALLGFIVVSVAYTLQVGLAIGALFAFIIKLIMLAIEAVVKFSEYMQAWLTELIGMLVYGVLSPFMAVQEPWKTDFWPENGPAPKSKMNPTTSDWKDINPWSDDKNDKSSKDYKNSLLDVLKKNDSLVQSNTLSEISESFKSLTNVSKSNGDTYFIIDGAKINASEEMTRNFYNNMMDLKRLGVMQSGYAQ